MELKVKLKPKQIKPIDMDYINDLKKICTEFISKKDFRAQNDITQQYNKNNTPENQIEELNFSSLICEDYEILGKSIVFKDNVYLYIKANSYDLILKLVQGFFHAGSISIGEAEFEILGMETLKSKLAM